MIVLQNSLQKVFVKPLYLFSAFVITGILLLFSIWLPNLSLVKNTLFSSYLSVGQKANLLIATLGGFVTNFTPLSQIITTLVAILFGINFSMLID